MSEETKVKLIRQDKFNKLDSHTNIYNTELLSSFKEEEKSTFLKIIKKVILGSNFTYYYSINYLVWEAISDILILFSFIFNSVLFDQLYLNKFFILIAIIIIFIPIVIFFILFYKSKKRKINNYMKNTTQCAIKEENNILLKNKLFCEISKDDFDILIKETDKDLDLGIKNEDIFFDYVLNFPNENEISK